MTRIAQSLKSVPAEKHLGVRMVLVVLSLLPAIFAMQAAQAQSFSTLFNFHDVDGNWPKSRLIADPAGNLYGTTYFGGAYGWGTVFKLDPIGNETVLYSFPDGAEVNGVVRDAAGNLYGTTHYSGAYGNGSVFKLDAAGDYTTLHSFNFSDGQYPTALIHSRGGYLYGTTYLGGAAGGGVVFKMDRAGNETVLHNFDGADVGGDVASLLDDAAGNLYGTTTRGGVNGIGVVFKLDIAGNYTVLYSFTGGLDGGYPADNLVLDSVGNLYGTAGWGGDTGSGGDTTCLVVGCGVVFKLDPGGNETVLHTFHGIDGALPYGGLFRNVKTGYLYGTTAAGGAFGDGVIFGISPRGTEHVLHSFRGGDGTSPLTGLLEYKGSLYGVTELGGDGHGTVFKVAH
jgi:uncharacterized repeat protein (TIGR03803 family)